MRSLITGFGLTVLALSSLFQTRAVAQSGAPATIRFEQVIANVFDEKGSPATGLSAHEFVIEENGKKTTVAGFNPGSDAPLSLLIMIDTSKQMAPMLGSAKGVIQPLLALLGPRDEYAIYHFDSDLHPIQPFGPIRVSDVAPLKEKLQELPAKGPTTSLYGIVADGATMMKSAKYARKALVVITDAKDRDAGNVGGIRRAVQLHGLSVYAIGLTGQAPKLTKNSDGEIVIVQDEPEKDTLAKAAAENRGMNTINRSTSLSDAGLQDVEGGLRASQGIPGMGGGMGGLGGRMGGMGGGGGMGGMGGMGMGGVGYNSPFGGGGNNNTASYGCNSQNSGFSNQSSFGASSIPGGMGAPNNSTGRFDDKFNNTSFDRGRLNRSLCNNSGSQFGVMPGTTGNNNGPGGPIRVMSVGRSAMLETMVTNGNGRMVILDLAFFATDAGTQQAVERVIGLGQDISRDLRGQYTLGYYTSSTEPIAERIKVRLSFDRVRTRENARVEEALKENAEQAKAIEASRQPNAEDEKRVAAAMKEFEMRAQQIEASRWQMQEASYEVNLKSKAGESAQVAEATKVSAPATADKAAAKPSKNKK